MEYSILMLSIPLLLQVILFAVFDCHTSPPAGEVSESEPIANTALLESLTLLLFASIILTSACEVVTFDGIDQLNVPKLPFTPLEITFQLLPLFVL